VSKNVRRTKPKKQDHVPQLIADVEALKTGMNEVLARLAKVEVAVAGPKEPAPEEPQRPETE